MLGINDRVIIFSIENKQAVVDYLLKYLNKEKYIHV